MKLSSSLVRNGASKFHYYIFIYYYYYLDIQMRRVPFRPPLVGGPARSQGEAVGAKPLSDLPLGDLKLVDAIGLVRDLGGELLDLGVCLLLTLVQGSEPVAELGALAALLAPLFLETPSLFNAADLIINLLLLRIGQLLVGTAARIRFLLIASQIEESIN
jgi:hypothetical protein